jgi:hypothetical protein
MGLFQILYEKYVKAVLLFSKTKEKFGITVPKVGFMEVRTQNAAQLDDLVKKFFPEDLWTNKDTDLENIPEAYSTHLYLSKRKFFSASDTQIAYILLKKEPEFVGIVIRVNVPNQSFYNAFKNYNNKLILAFKSHIEQYYQVDNFYIEFDFLD